MNILPRVDGCNVIVENFVLRLQLENLLDLILVIFSLEVTSYLEHSLTHLQVPYTVLNLS